MGTTLNKDAYKKLIKEDMEKVEKYFPEHSLEKNHIQEVLRCSIECYYPSEGKKQIDTETNCSIPVVVFSEARAEVCKRGECWKECVTWSMFQRCLKDCDLHKQT